MRRLPVWLYIGLFFLHGCLTISGVGKTAFAFEIDADQVLWNRLSYRAKSIFGKVTTDVYLQALPAEAVTGSLIADPAGEALQPSNATVLNLTVDSNISPLIGSDEIYKTHSWFEPDTAGALQRVRLRQGKEKWQKSYRFTKKGVFRLRKKPMDSREENLPLDQWTKIRNHFYLYGGQGLECPQILEAGSLLYTASAINLAPVSQPLSLCVFNKKQLHRVKVSVTGSQFLNVNYLEKQGNTQVRIDKKIDAVKISFQARSLAPPDTEPEDFSFLGLKGDFDIFIDKATRLPVQVSGKISVFGKIDIKLQAVSYPADK
jgi:hypothetical protein